MFLREGLLAGDVLRVGRHGEMVIKVTPHTEEARLKRTPPGWRPSAAERYPDASAPCGAVDPNLHEVGRVAAEHLLAAIDGEPAPGGLRMVPGWLVIRASTGATRLDPAAPAAPTPPPAPVRPML